VTFARAKNAFSSMELANIVGPNARREPNVFKEAIGISVKTTRTCAQRSPRSIRRLEVVPVHYNKSNRGKMKKTTTLSGKAL
jgi:hypothetical protein